MSGRISVVSRRVLLASIATLAVVRIRQPPYAVDTLDRWYATAIWGTVLVSPHVPLYDLSLLVLPALTSFRARSRQCSAISAEYAWW